MLVFEENKPNCDDNHRNQTISKRLTVFKAPGVKKSLLFPDLGFAVSVEDQ
jgi:hypothetical protein